MAWTTPRTWVAGETETAAIFNTHVRDNFKAIGDPWTSHSPSILNVTNSTVTAKYIARGKTVDYRFVFTLTAAPTGIVTVSLPFTATTSWGTGQQSAIGIITGLRQGTGYRMGHIYQASSTTVAFQSDGATAWQAATPVAWANTDIWSGSFTYEAA